MMTLMGVSLTGPTWHKVKRYNGGNLEPSSQSSIYNQWKSANLATNGGTTPDLATLCFSHSSQRRATVGSGASYGTCFAIAEHFDASRGTLMYKFGDSALQLDLSCTYTTTTGKQVTTLRGHAEISALAQAINSVVLPDSNYTCFLTRLYVELSPCDLCAKQLAPYIADTVLMYTYKYGDVREMELWVSDNQAGMDEYGGHSKLK